MVNNGQKTPVPDLEYLSSSTEEILKKLNTSLKGLSEAEVERRLEEYGHNEPARKKRRTIIGQILSRFVNPLVIVLLIIASFSLFFGQKISAVLVFLMAAMSVFLSFTREYSAGK